MCGAEVGEPGIAFDVHQDVGRLDIAVDQPCVMSILQRFRNLTNDVRAFLWFEWPFSYAFAQCADLHQRHDNVVDPFLHAEIQDRDNVRVMKAHQDLGLALESGLKILLFIEPGRQHLDGHFLLRLILNGFKDRGHPAAADPADEGIFA